MRQADQTRSRSETPIQPFATVMPLFALEQTRYVWHSRAAPIRSQIAVAYEDLPRMPCVPAAVAGMWKSGAKRSESAYVRWMVSRNVGRHAGVE